MKLAALDIPADFHAPRADELRRKLRQLKKAPESYDREAELVVAGLGQPGQGQILEIGPGIGIFLFELAQRGYEVGGVDIVKENVEQLNLLAKLWAPNCRVDYGDATKIDRPDSSVVGIYAMHVWEHVHDQRAALLEAARVLRPGGRLVILDGNFFNPGHWKEYFIDRARERRDPLAGFKWLFTKRRVLEDFGMGWKGKDEDLKSMWWWRRTLQTIPSMRTITATTTQSYRRRAGGRWGFGPLETFAGRIYVVAEKVAAS